MEYPPLLPAGLHVKTWAELQTMCVDGMPLSPNRAALIAGLRRIVDRLCAEGITGDLWIDGSFLTEKLEPGDIDLVLALAPDSYMGGTPNQRQLIEWLGSDNAAVRAQTKQDHHCDTYIFFEVAPGHPLYPGFDPRTYWANQFGRDRNNGPKGIAVLSIPGGVQ